MQNAGQVLGNKGKSPSNHKLLVFCSSNQCSVSETLPLEHQSTNTLLYMAVDMLWFADGEVFSV